MANLSHLRNISVRTPEVCPKSVAAPVDSAPLKPTEWAKKHFNFNPSKNQAIVIDSDSKYLMLCCNRQWGKTTAIAIKAMYHAVHRPNLSIVVLSRSKEQAGLLIRCATEFSVALGNPVRRVLGTQFSLKLPNGSQIAAVPHNTTSSLGRSAQILIVDEAAVVADEVYFSVAPFVSRTHGQIWLLSTPRNQIGFYYNFWHDLQLAWERILSNVLDCPEIDQEFLEMYRRSNPVQFAQEYMCEFVQPASMLTTRDFVRGMLRKRKPNS